MRCRGHRQQSALVDIPDLRVRAVQGRPRARVESIFQVMLLGRSRHVSQHLLVLVERGAVDEDTRSVVPRGRFRRRRGPGREVVVAPRVLGVGLTRLVLRGRRHVTVELGEVLEGLLHERVDTDVVVLQLLTAVEVLLRDLVGAVG